MTNRNVSNTCFSSKSSFNPKIYVACLASYNEGEIFGEWIDADQDPEVINEEIFNMLSKSPVANAEEYAIHGYEDFGSLHLNEYEGISTVSELAMFIQEHGELGAELVAQLGHLETAQDAIENNYNGQHNSELDFAMELFDECYLHEVPASIQGYIDYDSFRRDLFSCDYYSIRVDGQLHIFSNN